MFINRIKMHSAVWVPLITLLSLLIGCARTSPFVNDAGVPLVEPELTPSSIEAVVCFYRPFKFGSGLASPLLLIDGQPKLLLHNAGYTRIALSQGKHSIATAYSQQWVEGQVSVMELDVQAGQHYYIQVSAETRLSLSPFIRGATDFTFDLVATETAEGDLKGVQYLKPMD